MHVFFASAMCISKFTFRLQLPSTSSPKEGHKSCGPVGQKLTITPRMKLKRDRGVEQPLPNPFPLPLHYPSIVEAGLKAENPGIIPKYLSCVASSMLCHKMYPTREEYIQVANEIIRKYPWMKSKLGPPSVSENFSHTPFHPHISIIIKACWAYTYK